MLNRVCPLRLKTAFAVKQTSDETVTDKVAWLAKEGMIRIQLLEIRGRLIVRYGLSAKEVHLIGERLNFRGC